MTSKSVFGSVEHYRYAAYRIQRWHKNEQGLVHFLGCIAALREMHKNWDNWTKQSRRHELKYWLEVW